MNAIAAVSWKITNVHYEGLREALTWIQEAITEQNLRGPL